MMDLTAQMKKDTVEQIQLARIVGLQGKVGGSRRERTHYGALFASLPRYSPQFTLHVVFSQQDRMKQSFRVVIFDVPNLHIYIHTTTRQNLTNVD